MNCITFIYAVNYLMHVDGGIYSLHPAGMPQLLKKNNPPHGTHLYAVPAEQKGKTYYSADQRHNILYVGIL